MYIKNFFLQTCTAIDRSTALLVLFFLSSNLAASAIQNIYMRMLLDNTHIKLPSKNTFTESVLPMVHDKPIQHIENKLNKASQACLIVDLWSSNQRIDYIGLAANVCSKTLEYECFIIGFERMSGSHNAENIKKEVEKIVNRYDFDKKKITGK